MSKVAEHFKKHRWKYIWAGSILATAGITYAIVRTNSSLRPPLGDKDRMRPPLVDNSNASIGSQVFGTQNNYSVKRLSYIITQTGTDNFWRSQSACSRDTGISEHRLSDYFNHGRPLNENIELVREGVASNL